MFDKGIQIVSDSFLEVAPIAVGCECSNDLGFLFRGDKNADAALANTTCLFFVLIVHGEQSNVVEERSKMSWLLDIGVSLDGSTISGFGV